MTDPLAWIDSETELWSQRGLSRSLVPNGSAPSGRLVRGATESINFGSNDYLGLANDPRVRTAAVAAVERFGWGAGSSPLVTGWTEAHEALSLALARFEHTEAAVLFPSGFAANVGTIGALTGPGDGVYVDRLAHACLVDGARLSGASLRVFAHNDTGRLAAALRRDAGRFRRTLIATEGLFSMDGDTAPLADLADLAEEYTAMLLVDEAHATGVLGPDGRGAASAAGVADQITIRVGTLSKALGSVGGFVAGSRRLVDWLINHARTAIYSTSLPPAAASAALAALNIVRSEPGRREHLARLSERLRADLRSCGLLVPEGTGPIIPVVVGAPSRALELANQLLARGLYVPAIRPPTVPQDTARLRISLSAAHTEDDVAILTESLRRVQRSGS